MQGFIKLTESEIEDRLSVTVSRRLKKIENQKKREKLKMQQSLAKQMLENKMKQKLEQQGMLIISSLCLFCFPLKKQICTHKHLGNILMY